MSARSLTTTENDTHIHALVLSLFTGFELYNGHTISVRKQLLDFFLIVNTLCRSSLLDLHSSLKCLRQLGLVG